MKQPFNILVFDFYYLFIYNFSKLNIKMLTLTQLYIKNYFTATIPQILFNWVVDYISDAKCYKVQGLKKAEVLL